MCMLKGTMVHITEYEGPNLEPQTIAVFWHSQAATVQHAVPAVAAVTVMLTAQDAVPEDRRKRPLTG